MSPPERLITCPSPHFSAHAHVLVACTQGTTSENHGGWDAEQKNNRSGLTRVSEGMSDGGACAFSGPKIILICILCYMRSWSGQAYRTVGSS